MQQRTREELEAGLEHIRQSPKQHGRVELIVRRPAVNAREVVEVAELDVEQGLRGDNWLARGDEEEVGQRADRERQLTLMNARAIALIAGDRAHWPLAGDQFYVDLDLGRENLPAGTRLRLGTAVVEVTPPPHLGCLKFVLRYGAAAMQFVNSKTGRRLNLRGVNARVVQGGTVRAGDSVERL